MTATESLIQVTFRFGPSSEIRYLASPPRRGDRVRAFDGHVWLVTDVVEREDRYVVQGKPATRAASSRSPEGRSVA